MDRYGVDVKEVFLGVEAALCVVGWFDISCTREGM